MLKFKRVLLINMRLFLYLIIIFTSLPASAIEFPSLASPIALGAGNVKALKADPFSGSYHPGSLAFISKNSISMAFQSNYFIPGLNQLLVAANCLLPKAKRLSFSYGFFGNQYYNESHTKLGFAQVFSSKFGGGVALDYLRIQIPQKEFNIKHALTFDAAFYFTFNRHLDFAFHVINPLRVRFGNERLPFIINSTLIYNSSSKLILVAEFNQVMAGQSDVNIGLEYNFSKNFILRAGIQTKQFSPCFGVSISKKKYSIHLAFSLHHYLSSTSAMGFTYWQ